MGNIKLSAEEFSHTESAASNDPSAYITELNNGAVTLKQKLGVVSDFEGYSKSRNDIYKSPLTDLERDVKILELSKSFIDKHKAASLGFTPPKSPALDYKKQFDNLSNLVDADRVKPLMDLTLASEIELKTNKKSEPKEYSTQDLESFIGVKTNEIPENWLNEKIIPENWLNEKIIPENWLSEKIIPENWLDEKIIPENWLDEKDTPESNLITNEIPENWLDEKIIPENWLDEKGTPESNLITNEIPENWLDEKETSAELIDTPITPSLKM